MKTTMMNIAFFGTPVFAADILSGISQFTDIKIILAVSQPDKPVGRKQELLMTPVRQISLQKGIPVLQPERLRNNPFFVEELRKLKLDFIVVVAYGSMISPEILSIPKYGCINIHGSILPNYRGASPIQAAVRNGDTQTGLTIMYMNEKMDEWDILQIQKAIIGPDDTTPHIFEKFTQIWPKLLHDTLLWVLSGDIVATPQHHEKASYCHMIEKYQGEINFSKQTTREVYNLYRAYQPWPGVYLVIDGKKLALEKVSLLNSWDDTQRSEEKGTFVKIDKKTYGVVCADKKILLLHHVKPEGKKSMDIVSFVNGNRGILE
jgi:methionyl-tRNA formyltransferase